MSTIKEFENFRIGLQALKMATNNFSDSNYISRGGFGKVYKGELVQFGGHVLVAVKRLNRAFGQGTTEFWKEIMLLSRYKHENLVSLIGFCDEDGENILVYEYLHNKSLNMYLSGTNLSWIQRLNICIGSARGLEYLHNPRGTMQRVLHRDIKSANVLLDENWNAKISDFGLSKFGPANQEHTFLFSNVVGTFGYCDPLYVDLGYLTKESDVYSFGVVLFEVLCGRLCIENYDDNRRFLSRLAQTCYEEKRLDTIIHHGLREQISRECLERFSTVAYQCLRREHKERPPVAEIVNQLEIAFQYQVLPLLVQTHNVSYFITKCPMVFGDTLRLRQPISSIMRRYGSAPKEMTVRDAQNSALEEVAINDSNVMGVKAGQSQHAYKEENMLKGKTNIRKRHMISFLAMDEKGEDNKLRKNESGIEDTNHKNKELHDRIKELATETQQWQYRAKYNESVANALRTNLEQVLAQGSGIKEGFGGVDVEDGAESSSNP